MIDYKIVDAAAYEGGINKIIEMNTEAWMSPVEDNQVIVVVRYPKSKVSGFKISKCFSYVGTVNAPVVKLIFKEGGK